MMIEQLKKKLAYFQLNRELKSLIRERKSPNIHTGKSIGILYDASEKQNFENMKEFFRDLKALGKNPVMLGYINQKEVTFHPLARPEADYFYINELNWFEKPSGRVVQNFVDVSFDILINVSTIDHFPLDYIAAASKAGFKVGRANAKTNAIYDMTLAIDENADIQTFAYLIVHYLNNLNNQTHAKSQRNRSSHHHTV
jgi:hypothetical protein